MARALDPQFSTAPVHSGTMGPQPNVICSATSGPDDPYGIDGPIEPRPEPAMSEVSETDAFIEYSPNIVPPPPSGHITEPKIIYWSQDGTTKEFTGWECSLYDLHNFSRDPETGLRKAVKVRTLALPFEFSVILDTAGYLDYFLEHVDDITFCPLLIMADMDASSFLYLSSAAAYVQDGSKTERKLFININRYVEDAPNGEKVFEARADFEALPDLVDGAVRLHIITNVMNRVEPADHLNLSYIRRQSIPMQISAIDAIGAIFEEREAREERAYSYLMKLKQELTEELKRP